MNEANVPAGVPPNNTKYVVAVALLILGIGGILFWKCTLDKPAPVAETTPTAPTATGTYKAPDRTDLFIPPPAPVLPSATVSAVQAVPGRGPAMGGGCEAKCTGTATLELAAALTNRGAQARSCYNQALASDSTLKGNVNIGVKVGANGEVCGAYVAGNDMGGSGGAYVGNCAVGVFRGATYPPPRGGCVDASIPLSFKSR